MQRRSTLLGGLVAITVAAAPALLAAAPALQDIKDGDLKALGKALSKYLEIDRSNEEYDKRRGKVVEAIEKIGKRLDKDAPVDAFLARNAELGQAFHYAEVESMRSAGGGKASTVTFPYRETEMEFELWLPDRYKPDKGPYPVVVVVPGIDPTENHPMRPAKFLQEQWGLKDLRDRYAIAVLNMPEDASAWELGAAPDGSPGGVAYVMLALKELRRAYAVDSERIFLAGRGRGVETVVELGHRFPQLWAGILGVAGDAGETSWRNYKNLPTWFAGGGARVTTFQEGSAKDGYDNCTLAMMVDDSEMLKWLDAHPRVSNPEHVILFPGSPIPNIAYWLKVPPIEATPDTRVEARIDRTTNTIVVTGNVPSVFLHLSDQLVDLSKPVVIELNGTRQEVLFPRDLDTALDLYWRGTSDPGRIYTVFKSFDLPAK